MIKKNSGKSAPASVAIALAIVAAVAVWFQSGSIKVDCKDTSVKIKASYWAGFEISYSEIDTVTYRKNLDIGERTVGVGSSKLSVGTFQNDEFGSYTLYAYTDSTRHIVLTSGGKTIVIGLSSAKDTEALYNTLKKRTGN